MKGFLMLILLCGSTLATQKHLICKSVEDVFAEPDETGVGSRTAIVQGRSGKRGPPGVRGQSGPPGSPGMPGNNATVDYDVISEMIKEKIREELGNTKSVLEELRRNYTNLQKAIELKQNISQREESAIVETSDAACREGGGLAFDGKCFTIPYISASHDLSYSAAKEKCRNVGSLLAEIHTRSQQTELVRYVRTKMPSSSNYNHVWIGMTYLNTKKTLQYRSGKETSANQFQWRPGYPSSSRGGEIIILLYKDPNQSSNGIWNGYDGPVAGVVCEKTL